MKRISSGSKTTKRSVGKSSKSSIKTTATVKSSLQSWKRLEKLIMTTEADYGDSKVDYRQIEAYIEFTDIVDKKLIDILLKKAKYEYDNNRGYEFWGEIIRILNKERVIRKDGKDIYIDRGEFDEETKEYLAKHVPFLLRIVNDLDWIDDGDDAFDAKRIMEFLTKIGFSNPDIRKNVYEWYGDIEFVDDNTYAVYDYAIKMMLLSDIPDDIAYAMDEIDCGYDRGRGLSGTKTISDILVEVLNSTVIPKYKKERIYQTLETYISAIPNMDDAEIFEHEIIGRLDDSAWKKRLDKKLDNFIKNYKEDSW